MIKLYIIWLTQQESVHRELSNLTHVTAQRCDNGFEKRNGECVDIDECANDSGGDSFFSIPGDSVCPTGANYRCVNSVGSFSCVCKDGYEADPISFDDNPPCDNIDECRTNNGRGPCDHHCVDIDGSYECSCNSGFQLADDRNACVDIPECSVNNGGCEQQCSEEEGSYRCSCQSGYELAGDGKGCVDMNECLNGSHGCSHKCVNMKGGYECSCHSRYTQLWADKRTCVDIDECSIGTHKCPADQTCINTDNGYDCQCPVGFQMRMSSCFDIDECRDFNACAPAQQCFNTPGSYRCECSESGYQPSPLDPDVCQDIDECLLDPYPCDANQRCINKPGSFKCRRGTTTSTTTTTTTTTTTSTTTSTTTTTTSTSTTPVAVTTKMTPAAETVLGLPKLVFVLIVVSLSIVVIGILICVIVCVCKNKSSNEAGQGYRPGSGVKIYKSDSDSKNSMSNDLNHELLRNTQPIFTGPNVPNNKALNSSHQSYNNAVSSVPYEDHYQSPNDDFNQPAITNHTYHSSSTIPNDTNDPTNRPRPPPPQPLHHRKPHNYQMPYPAPQPVPPPRNPVN